MSRDIITRTRLFIGLTLLFNFHNAQNFCYTSEMQEKWFNAHPELREKYLEQRQKLISENFENQNKPAAAAAAAYTIPVVFHILHQGGNENISDAQVIDAVNILTRDFNKLNADTSNVVNAFKNLIGNPQIEFQLATKDPNGVCTSGIIRHWDANTLAWDGDWGKYVHSWPSNQYLNIYVVKLITFPAAGYTYLPGSGVPPDVDAIVVLSSYVGSIGTGNVGLSRVLTHEVGHWLNLEHTWGWNSVGTTCGDDGVTDTPLTRGWTSCNLGMADICTSGVTENVQNYMEYAYCARMFTMGQSTMMQNTFLNTFFNRDYLSDPQNLIQTGITLPGINCTPLVDILAYPGATVCAGKTLSLKSFTWNAAPTSYIWSATAGANITSPNSQSTTITFNSPGTVTITCVVNNSAGTDAETVVITVRNGSTDITSSSSESFENPNTIFPVNWSVINPTTTNEKWMISGLDGANGTKCAFVPGELLSPGSVEILESPSYDFKNHPGANFSFKYAYARYSAQHTDLFKVQASKNCGASWADIWVPGMAGLANGSGGIDANLFHPTVMQWKFYDLTAHPNFIPFLNEENVRLRFYFEEDATGMGQGNRFYLDDINFTAPTSIKSLEARYQFELYPNPSDGSVELSLLLESEQPVQYNLSDLSGRIIIESSIISAGGTKTVFRLNEDKTIQPGVYFLNLRADDFYTSRKIIIQ